MDVLTWLYRCDSVYSSPQPRRARPSSEVSLRGSQLSILRAPPRPHTHSLGECFLGARSVPSLRAGDGAPWTIGLCPGARRHHIYRSGLCTEKEARYSDPSYPLPPWP